MEEMIVRCAGIHLEHIGKGGDPFENGTSRPLDFGHWSAHNIEELTSGDVTHGDAVAIGIALDSLYALRIGYINTNEIDLIVTALQDVGFSLSHPALRKLDVESALEGFREHLGGQLTITFPKGIGNKIDVHTIDTELMKSCIQTLLTKYGAKERTHEHSLSQQDGKRNNRSILH
jgi:3-dehydroquinate synthase